MNYIVLYFISGLFYILATHPKFFNRVDKEALLAIGKIISLNILYINESIQIPDPYSIPDGFIFMNASLPSYEIIDNDFEILPKDQNNPRSKIIFQNSLYVQKNIDVCKWQQNPATSMNENIWSFDNTKISTNSNFTVKNFVINESLLIRTDSSPSPISNLIKLGSRIADREGRIFFYLGENTFFYTKNTKKMTRLMNILQNETLLNNLTEEYEETFRQNKGADVPTPILFRICSFLWNTMKMEFSLYLNNFAIYIKSLNFFLKYINVYIQIEISEPKTKPFVISDRIPGVIRDMIDFSCSEGDIKMEYFHITATAEQNNVSIVGFKEGNVLKSGKVLNKEVGGITARKSRPFEVLVQKKSDFSFLTSVNHLLAAIGAIATLLFLFRKFIFLIININANN